MSEELKGASLLASAQPSTPNGGQVNERQLPEHLIGISEGRWALWRWVGLRGAGFPSSLPLRLSAPECAAVADRLLDSEGQVRQARENALDALRRDWDSADADKQARLGKAIKALKKDRLLESLEVSQGAGEVIDEYRAARAGFEAASADFAQAFESAVERTSQAMCDLAGMNSLREAIIWQNRHAFQTGIKALAQKTEGKLRRDSKHRQHEELIASYLQRYCLKNDTIGFFGPVGWARLTDRGEALSVKPGDGLVASREVYFEGWCIDAIAKEYSKNKEILRWLAPRRIPPVHLEGNMLYTPFSPPSRIPEKQAAVLQNCNGDRAAKDLVAYLSHAYPSLFGGEKEIYGILEALSAMGMISWTLEVQADVHPERLLRRQIERIGDESLSSPAMKALDELEEARRNVAASAGDAEKLDLAMGELQSTFTRLTGAASTRNEGKTYAGRTLIYEDCRRDIDVEIGPDFLRTLEQPLSLLLASARWFTHQVAIEFRKFSVGIHAQMAERTRSPLINAANFVGNLTKIFTESKWSPADTVESNFQQRWSKILPFTEDQRRVQYSSAELRRQVLDVFDAPHAGWHFARYHSPDIMISAPSVEAIRGGDYLLVMGELHQASNTLVPAFWMEQHPAREDLMRAIDSDMNKPRLVPIRTKSMSDSNSRTMLGLYSSKDFLLAAAPDAFGAPPSRTVPIGSLVVENVNGELFIRTRDGRLRFELIEALGSILSTLVTSVFKLLPHTAHSPRISIDRLVVNRETWRMPVAEMKFAFEKDEAARYVAARRWARGYGMPRFAFGRTPVEIKPFFVDFSSPVYVSLLSKMVRRTVDKDEGAAFTISEMLPSVDEIWLPDNKGQRYASELRIVAVDHPIESE